ncbi:ABC transporter permease [Patescibacteria group bacterium]|nr:ABC transporter permease [Patescibacteria group bacterium]MBU1889916.1 ABC transporter permease [Patescibacteria group bacterium]
MISFYRALKFAFQSFKRNVWLSAATILILVLTLFSVSLVGTINFIGDRAIRSVKDKVDLSVYFYPEVGEKEVQAIQARLQTLPSVKNVNYIPKEQALEEFIEKHKDDPVISETLEILDDNPLGATLVIQAKDIEKYSEILNVMSDPNYSDMIYEKDIEDYQTIIRRLTNMTDRIYQITFVISMIFIIIAILVVFNTIRITIYTHREEIGIMRLVGATNWFIRGPFILESMIYAVISTIISVGILYPILRLVSPQVTTFFEGYNLNLANYFSDHFIEILGLQLIVALVLSMISSMIAVGRHLRA